MIVTYHSDLPYHSLTETSFVIKLIQWNTYILHKIYGAIYMLITFVTNKQRWLNIHICDHQNENLSEVNNKAFSLKSQNNHSHLLQDICKMLQTCISWMIIPTITWALYNIKGSNIRTCAYIYFLLHVIYIFDDSRFIYFIMQYK